MSSFATKLGRTGVIAAISVGLIATVSVDVGVAGTHGGSSHHAGGKSAAKDPAAAAVPASYLKAVGQSNAEAYAAIAPLQKSLNLVIDPKTSLVVAVRDAVSHSDAHYDLRAVQGQLSHLTAPTNLTANQHALAAAARKLLAAAATLDSLDAGSYEHALNELEGGAATKLGTAEAAWDHAVASIYRVAKTRAPQKLEQTSYRNLPASRSSWVLAADQVCENTDAHLLPSLLTTDKEPNGDSKAERVDSLWVTALTSLRKHLTAIPRPGGRDALPHGMIARMKIFSYSAQVFEKMTSDVKNNDLAGYETGRTQLQTNNAEQFVVANELKAYGAQGCSDVLDVWSGHASQLFRGSSHSYGNGTSSA